MKKFLVISLTSLLFFACSKENSDYFVPYQNHPLNDTAWAMEIPSGASVNELSRLLAQPPLLDSFDASTGAGIHFPDLDISIPQGTCMFSNNTPVTGIVKLEVKQLRKKGDYIRHARANSSYGNLLESDGAFFIKAIKDGQEVFINPDKHVGLTFQEANPANDMSVFYGKENIQPPLPPGTHPSFTWIKATDSSRVTSFSWQGPSGIVKGYNLKTRKFNWISCARFIDSSLPKTYITALLPANFTNMNTTVYAVFKQQKTVMRLNGEYSSKTFFAPNIPLNSNIVLVSLTFLNNTLYLGTKDVTTSDNMILSINPSIKTAEEIGRFLDGL